MKVNIKGSKYEIVFYKNFGICGETDLKDKIISIRLEKNDLEEQYSTIFHELLHAFFWECGLVRHSSDETLIYWIETNIKEIISLANQIQNAAPQIQKNSKSFKKN